MYYIPGGILCFFISHLYFRRALVQLLWVPKRNRPRIRVSPGLPSSPHVVSRYGVPGFRYRGELRWLLLLCRTQNRHHPTVFCIASTKYISRRCEIFGIDFLSLPLFFVWQRCLLLLFLPSQLFDFFLSDGFGGRSPLQWAFNA